MAVGHKLVVQVARESPLFFFILLTMLADQSPFYSIFYQMIKWPFLSFCDINTSSKFFCRGKKNRIKVHPSFFIC